MPLSPALKYSSLLLHFLRLLSCHFSCLPAPAKLSQKEEKKNCFNRRRREGKYSHGTFKLSRGREMPHTCKRQKKKRFLSFAIFRGIKWRRRPFWFGSRREPKRGGNIFLSSTLGDSFRGKKEFCECALKRPVIGLSLFLLPTPTFISSCPIAGGRRTVGRKLMLQLPFQPPLIKKSCMWERT